MALSRLVLGAFALCASHFRSVEALPQDMSKRQNTSLPFPIDHFTSTVASVQNTYCGDTYNVPGVEIGDQTLLKAFGNGDTLQRTNIYHSKSLGIIVASMGTNLSSFVSSVHNVEFIRVLPSSDLGLPLGATVFQGFKMAWEDGWDNIKQGISEVLEEYPGEKLIVTGHSQGGAIALLNALSIYHEFGDIIKEVIAYGVPRVGNAIFADAFDDIFTGKYTAVVNGADWVPTLPPQILGYRHPSSMVWIDPANTTSWEFYEGQENSDGPNSKSPEIFYPGTLQIYWGDHQGIYMHSSMGTTLGPCPAQVGGF